MIEHKILFEFREEKFNGVRVREKVSNVRS